LDVSGLFWEERETGTLHWQEGVKLGPGRKTAIVGMEVGVWPPWPSLSRAASALNGISRGASGVSDAEEVLHGVQTADRLQTHHCVLS